MSEQSINNPLPPNTTPDTFASRPVIRGGKRQRKSSFSSPPPADGVLKQIWKSVVGDGGKEAEKRLKMRKVPIKVEP